MSKTLADMAKILSASNEELFDRFVDVRLTRNHPSVGAFDPRVDFQIRTPVSGLKPNITVSGTLTVSRNVNGISVTIGNITEQIDTMAYNWCEVRVGYLNSGIFTTFVGQITNCYMAKPNPNGELVINMTCADISDFYNHGDFSVGFLKDNVSTQELIQTCVQSIQSVYPDIVLDEPVTIFPSNLSLEWKTQKFYVGKATRHFRSPLACLAWLNSLFASFTYYSGYSSINSATKEGEIKGSGGFSGVIGSKTAKGLAPLRIGFDMAGKLKCYSTYSESASTVNTVKALHAIGSALKKSTDSATVTAPFNPEIFPGDLIYVDARYFKTRINIPDARDRYKASGDLWFVVTMSFTFSTITTNTMTLELVNEKLQVNGSEG